jgi:putative ABC transport system permease protein
MVSIAMVVATGIMAVVTMRGSYESLVLAQQSYYRHTRLAEVWAPLKRAPESMRRKIAALPGVASVDTRVTFMATLDLPGLDAPAQGLFVSVPSNSRPVLNDILIERGRYLAPGRSDEVIVSKKFAEARGYDPGDSLRAVINGRARDLRIVGMAISPEHTYSVPPGSLYPDDERYGVVWMGREAVGPAYDMEGAFNEALVTLTPGTDVNAVIERLDRLLDPFGALGAYARKDQSSHAILEAELDQNRVMGTVIPAIFLAVAAFLLNLVLGRLIATQRGEIAVLKAFGYRNREVGTHFLLFALASVVAGAALGTGSGIWLGQAYVELYGQYFDFPNLAYRLSGPLLSLAILVSFVAAGAGAMSAVRRAASLPPAEAMRPEPPASFEPGVVERTGLGDLLPSSGRMILRNIERQLGRSFLSSLGVAFSVAILVLGLFMFDGVRFMMDLQFREIQREDISITFVEALSSDVRFELGSLTGVTHVEPFRSAPARLRAGHRSREISLTGLEPEGRLRRIVTANAKVQPVPSQGVILSDILARQLDVTTGDLLLVEMLDGRRAKGSVHVAGVVEDFLGVSAYMSRAALHDLEGGPDLVSGAFLGVEEEKLPALQSWLKGAPSVAGVASPSTMLESFEKQMAESLYVGIGFLLGFASVIAIGIIYNGARISLSERGRELASLRVMGFRRSEVSMLLLGEQAAVTLLAIPLGWAIAYVLSFLVVGAMETETYRIPFITNPQTYLTAAVITAAVAAGSGLIVRRRVNRLNLIEVLKTRE